MKDEAIDREFNPYAAPKAEVQDAAVAGGEALFFPVSLLKLSLMSIVTFGLYEIYWFYKNWKCVNRNYGENVLAPVRALFYPLISYPLFARIRSHAQKAGIETELQAGGLAVAVFVVAMLWRLPDPWWLVSFLGFLPLLPVQSTVNAINARLAPQADRNTRFGGWNIFGLVFGGLMLILSIIGVLLPE